MSTAGMRFLSKVADNGDAGVFKRYDIRPEHFATETEQKIARFIIEYGERNRNRAPSVEELAGEFGNAFADEYYADVPATFDTLAEEIKSDWAEREFIRVMRDEYLRISKEKKGVELVRALAERANKIVDGASVKKSIGRTLEDLGRDGIAEYKRRKEGKTFKRWNTPFPTLTEGIGGLYSGDCYCIIAESGRGKTYLTIAFVDELLRQGATVLFKSFETKWFIVLSRLVSILTARDEMFTDDRTNQKVGIRLRGILNGTLEEDEENAYYTILGMLNDYYPGQLILQAKSDDNLTRSLTDLDRELHANPEIDVVVMDPFNNISDVYGRNVNRTTGGAAEFTARRFEQIVGDHDVVGIFTIQSTIELSKEEKEKIRQGKRELKLPTRDQVKTTKAALDIVSNLFSFDNVDGNARIATEKGRHGGDGIIVDLIALLDVGVLREVPSGEAVRNQFDFDF